MKWRIEVIPPTPWRAMAKQPRQGGTVHASSHVELLLFLLGAVATVVMLLLIADEAGLIRLDILHRLGALMHRSFK